MTSLDRADAVHATFVQEHHPVSERGGEVEIVRHRQTESVLREPGGEELEEVTRAADRDGPRARREAGLGPLGKSPRQSHQFLLPARQLRNRAPARSAIPVFCHRLFDRLYVIGARKLKAP